VSTLKKYKKLENGIAKKVGTAVGDAARAVGDAAGKVNRVGRQKLTVMFVPHTEKRIVNFQLSFYGLVAIALALVTGLGLLVYSSVRYTDASLALSGKADSLQETRKDLDALRDETTGLVRSARAFETALATTLSRIGVKISDASDSSRDGDLAAFFDVQDLGTGSLREVGAIRQVAGYLDKAVKPLEELGALMEAQESTLSEIPNIWPIQGGIGHISMYYGQNEHPLFGYWYLHQGLDISTFRSGDPILATADGTVVTVASDTGYGNYVIIMHKHGFFTRYAHMQVALVTKGQVVRQGQPIGRIGNTGISTGPHLHYEVHLGTETIDPLRFLHLRSAAR